MKSSSICQDEPYTREGIAEHDSFRKANNNAKCVKAVGGCDSFPRLTQTAALLLSHRECAHGTYGFIFDCIHIFRRFVTSHVSKKKRLSQFSTCNGFSSNPEILIKKVLSRNGARSFIQLFNNGKEIMLSIYMDQVLVQKHSLLDQQMLSKIFLPQTWLLQWQNLLLSLQLISLPCSHLLDGMV